MAETVPLILVIDDEAAFREIFGAKLSAEGYRIESAENAAQGIEKARALHPDLILMDVKMPGTDGTHAAQTLQDDPSLHGLKIVFLTSLGDPSTIRQEIDRQFTKSFGFAGYIKKSDDLNAIVAQVKGFLAN